MTVDGEKALELETLLKASAYILGATGSSIMYKAVLEDGSSLAVRRIGEHSVDRFKDFENQVKLVAKLVHPNLVRIRGFYWGVEEKLIIYDFVPNGSLANARYSEFSVSVSLYVALCVCVCMRMLVEQYWSLLKCARGDHDGGVGAPKALFFNAREVNHQRWSFAISYPIGLLIAMTKSII